MAQPFVEIDASEFFLLEETVGEMAGIMNDLTDVWPSLTTGIANTIERRFTREGPGWPQLARRTIADRKRQGFPGAHPILVRRGDLRKSFLEEAHTIFTPEWMYYASSSRKAAYHQTGRKKGNWTLPARPMIVADEHIDGIQAAFEDAMIERVNKVWHQKTGRGTFRGFSG